MCHAGAARFRVMGLRLNRSTGFSPSARTGVAVTICRCRECGLIFANPQPIPLQFSDQYDVSPEEYWHDLDLEWRSSYFKKELGILEKLGFRFEGSRSLDIGAGIGKGMRSMSEAGMDAFGFEPVEAFYKVGISRYGLSPGRFKLGTIEDAEYPDDYFDFITFDAVLEHLHDPDGSLVKALRWLKPGGFIHIEVPSSNWFIAKLYNFYYRCRLTSFVTNTSPMHSPFHHFEFSRKSFEKSAVRNGFTIAHTHVEVCETTTPIKSFDFLLKRYMKWTGTGLQLIVFLRKNG
jgi:ubiquinone/menaquinone biosynthesis C-methylase UbiE